ncbi:DUF4153 domain-containing protein [Halocola ammonii]
MKKVNPFLIVLVFTILHYLMFYGESDGLNTLIYSSGIFGYLFLRDRQMPELPQLILICCHGFAALGVVLVNSSWSIFMYVLTFSFALASYHEGERKSMIFLFPSILVNLLVSPFRTLTLPKLPNRLSGKSGKRKFAIKVAIVPIVIVGFFTILYSAGNPVFGSWVEAVVEDVAVFIEKKLENLSFLKFLFLILGFWIGSFAIVYGGIKVFGGFDSQLKLNLKRIRKPKQSALFNKITDLKKEYLIALLVFGAMNFLLLIINTIDVSWVWFSFDRSDVENLSQFVHEGTYILILSILVSMTLILFYFRGNLNFYPENKKLRVLAGLWLLQNFILVISIAIRNWHYIAAYNAITYKRIGVFVFLILVIIGLVTVYFKIKNKQTITQVVRVNFLSVFTVLSLLSVFNWDGVIARYNLSAAPPEEINYNYLRRLSVGALPAIHDHAEMLLEEGGEMNRERALELKHHIRYKVSGRINRNKSESWVSWNLRDYRLSKLNYDE